MKMSLNKILSNTTGLLWGMAIGMSVINFVDKPSVETALAGILIFSVCCYMAKDEKNQEDNSYDKDLEIVMLKNENAGLKALVSTSEAVQKSSDMVIKDLKKQVERLELGVSLGVLPVIDEETGKRMLSNKAKLNEEYLQECLKLRDKYKIVK
jgi:hypothetical protein